MKTMYKFIFVALSAISLAACNTKEDVLPDQNPSTEGFTYTVAISGETKAYLDTDHMTWESGDMIGWFTDKAGSSEINMSTTPRSFEVVSTNPLSAGSIIYAYSPYKAGDQTAASALLSIPAEQDGVITDAMPMVSLPIEVKDASTAEASFVNLGAVIRYIVYTSNEAYASEKVQSVTFASDSYIAGDFIVDLTAVSADALPSVSGLDQNSVTSTLAEAAVVGATKDDGVKLYQVVAPGTWSGKVTVTTDVATYEYAIDGKEFNRASIKTLNVDLASVNAVRTKDIQKLLTSTWWELKSVKEVGNNVTTSVGNKMKLNEDLSIEFDCSANGGMTFCHTWNGCLINPGDNGDLSAMEWCSWSEEGVDYLGVSSGYLLVMVQENLDWAMYEIKELSSTRLVVETVSWGGTWTLVFEATDTTVEPDEPVVSTPDCPYWYEFVDGDFGIGPAFDWGGWYDGYYYDMLTTPYTLGGASWAITDAGFFEWAGTEGWRKGIQLGTAGMTISPFKLSSSSFPGEITSVTLGYNSGIVDGESLTVSCTVGGQQFGTTVAHGDGDYEATFIGSASGEIEISLNSTVNGAVYLYYLYVEYNPN
jgi:hypothetical protein